MSVCCATVTVLARELAATHTAVTNAVATSVRVPNWHLMAIHVKIWTSAVWAIISVAPIPVSTRSGRLSAPVPTATCSAMIGKHAKVTKRVCWA